MTSSDVTLRSVIKEENFYFNPPLPGEPSSSLHYQGTTPERVVQSAKKGMECWFTVMSWLRSPIGFSFDPKLEEALNAEKLVVNRRDMLNQAQSTLEYLQSLDAALKEGYQLEEVTKTEAAKFEGPLRVSDSDRQKCETALKGFQEQSLAENFAEFAMHNYFRMCNQCDEYFLYGALYKGSKEGFSQERLRRFIVDLYEGTAMLHTEKPWDELALSEKRWALGSMAIMACGALFGFKQASWNPNLKVTHLITEMREHGPLMVQGYFGQPYYQDQPFQLADKVGRSAIFGWKPGAARNEDMKYQFHPILVVGARSDLKDGYVYFVDALDKSDPSETVPRPIYIMSYSKFQEGVATLDGLKVDRSEIVSGATNFAWYGPFKGNQKSSEEEEGKSGHAPSLSDLEKELERLLLTKEDPDATPKFRSTRAMQFPI